MNINKARTISQLPDASNEIPDSSFIEVSEFISNKNPGGTTITGYASRKLKFGDFNNQSLAKIMAELEKDYSSVHPYGHSLKTGLNFQQLSAYVYQLVNGQGTTGNLFKISQQLGNHTFAKIPSIEEFVTNYSSDSKQSVNAGSLVRFSLKNNRLYITHDSDFTTMHYNIENMEFETLNGIEHAPSSTADKHNVYIFKIKNFTSNTWEAPMDGWFVCYGWVDEYKSTGMSNANRWVALEGSFKSHLGADQPDEWHIVQLQPMMPSEFCSYISFSLPVSKGMKFRLTTGFKVGTNSEKYQSLPGSLTNHIANAFVGGIYGSKCTAFAL